METPHSHTDVELLYITTLAPTDRVYCQHPGCTRTVYAKVHIVKINDELQFVGSTCFKKLFGHLELSPSFGGGTGNTLSHEEREHLVKNTETFIQAIQTAHEEGLAKLQAIEAAKIKKDALAKEAWQQNFAQTTPPRSTYHNYPDQRRRHMPNHRKLIPIFGCFKCSNTPNQPYEFKSPDKICPRCGSTNNFTWRQEEY